MSEAARIVSAEEIPVVSLAPLRDGSAAGLARTAQAIHGAATTSGFFYVSDHGIPPGAIERARAAVERFFALPAEAKAAIAVNQINRGFLAQGNAVMYGAAEPDQKEIFFWGAELAADDPDVLAGRPLCGPNQWPPAMPELKDEIWPYYQAVCGVGRQVLRAIAASLGLAPDFFEPFYTKPLARGQLVYYPAQPPKSEKFGVAPHTDYGCITLLLQDMNGGLEVRRRDGTWIAAVPIQGTLVVNVGDLLGRWSNDRFASTPHRVVNRSGRRRHSIPVFFDPNTDAVIDPRAMNLPPGMAPRYEPVTAGGHIMGRNRKSFAHYKD